ncbi:hypothetical protein [Nocardiopsis halophila]|uniref:hypothetical protein n=1 Tax=Nocardiopsis halophila TaxID=141692 RepID=UPI000345E50F|nr:hypothetical protein [Nocardiopsis halophila]
MKKRPGAVTAIRVFVFISAGFAYLIGLILTGMAAGALLSPDVAADLDMEGSARGLVLGFGLVIVTIGGLMTWLGVRAGRPGKGIMWTIVVLYSISAFFNLITLSLVGFGVAVLIIVLAVSGNGRAFYEGRWGPWYHS